MVGGDRIRHCAECNLNVYNFATMSNAEVEDLISNRGERLCVRLYQRQDGTILTKDCPVGFQVKIRRISRIAGAALTAAMSVAGAAAQTVPATRSTLAVQLKQKSGGIIVGVFDEAGAVIPEARIRLTDKSGFERFAGVTGADGTLKTNLSLGLYVLTVDSPGFEHLRQLVKVTHDETVVVHLNVSAELLQGGPMFSEPMSAESENLDIAFKRIVPVAIDVKPLPPSDKKANP